MDQENHITADIEDQLTLEYRGPVVETGRMDAYDVAGYIIAFSDFLGTVSRRAYGEKIVIRTEIQGFRSGSFDIDFAFQIAGIAAGLFLSSTPASVKDFIELIRGSMKAWIHLRGEPPKAVAPVPTRPNTMQIENQNGHIMYVAAEVVNIIGDQKAGKAVEHFIKKPLDAGVAAVCINSKVDAQVIEIPRDDASAFVPLAIEKPLLESEMRMGLLIESPTFKEGNKWRFFDGQSSFYADIIDEDFLRAVNSGTERFGKGDELIAMVRFTQTIAGTSLRMERSVIKVLEHRTRPEPGDLFGA